MTDGTVDKVAEIYNADLEGGPDLKEHYALEGNEVGDYYATGQEYRSYANETDKPVWTDEEKKLLGIDSKSEAKSDDDGPKIVAKSDDAESKTESTPASTQTPTTPTAPKAPAAPAASK